MKEQLKHIIQQTLNSTEGMQRAEAPSFLYGRMMERMKQHVPEPVYYGGRVLFRFAMMVVVVMLINMVSIKVLKQNSKQQVSDHVGMQQVAQEYFGFENTNPYNY